MNKLPETLRVYLVQRGRLLEVECVEHGVVWRSVPRKGRTADGRRALLEHERAHAADNVVSLRKVGGGA